MDTRYIGSPDDLSAFVMDDVMRLSSEVTGPVRIGLPGGRSARPLVRGLLGLEQSLCSRLHLYLVDERLEGESNAETLLDAGLGEAFGSGKLDRSRLVVPQAGMPFLGMGERLSAVYLGVGEDGHVASLFPGSWPDLDGGEGDLLATVDQSPKPPPRRITVTYRGFRQWASAARCRLLFFGEGKYDALARLQAGTEDASTLPCAFFRDEGFDVTVVTDRKENG